MFELIGTWLGLGLGGFEAKGLGPGLDNFVLMPVSPSFLFSLLSIKAPVSPRNVFRQH